MKMRYGLLVGALIAACCVNGTLFATTPFKNAFEAKYVKGGSAEFQAAFRKAGCNTCHVKGKKKEIVNEYGWALSEAIEGNAKDRTDAAKEQGDAAKEAEEKKLLAEFEAAMKKVESSASAGGQTFGELLKAHQLPSAGEKSIR
ncbi:MAG: hypothetical protein AB7F89_12185 [Pirellulaceae bacterium]